MFRISLFAALFLIAHISLVGEDVAIRAAAANTSTPRPAPAAEPAATDDGITMLTAELPAVVSVGEKINEPRYPSFKGIMAAKKKPVSTLTLADAGIDPAEVGLAAATSRVTSAQPKPPKSAGERVTDEGDGGARIAAFLVAQKLI